jgi:hypothetical protein
VDVYCGGGDSLFLSGRRIRRRGEGRGMLYGSGGRVVPLFLELLFLGWCVILTSNIQKIATIHHLKIVHHITSTVNHTNQGNTHMKGNTLIA